MHGIPFLQLRLVEDAQLNLLFEHSPVEFYWVLVTLPDSLVTPLEDNGDIGYQSQRDYGQVIKDGPLLDCHTIRPTGFEVFLVVNGDYGKANHTKGRHQKVKITPVAEEQIVLLDQVSSDSLI